MASLKRIAAELDVSYTLVSKVLSGRLGTTGVSPTTREAIIKKAKELDYVPNRLAVALKAGRKGAVGIFFHHLGSPGSDVSDRLLRGLAEGLDQSGFRMWLRFFTTDEGFVAACDARLKSEVDGLIVAGVYHSGLKEKLRELERQNVPVITLFNDDPTRGQASGTTSVQVDYVSHGYIATKHLLQQGCTRLVCFATVESRTEGFLKAHREAGLKVDPRLVMEAPGFSLVDGKETLERLLHSKVPFDGIVCQSDAQANGVINELVLRGVKIPEEVKITGVDNSPLAEDCIVPITSMTSEMRGAGLKAVELLLKRIEGEKVKSVLIEPSLYIRNSSGAGQLQYIDRRDLE